MPLQKKKCPFIQILTLFCLLAALSGCGLVYDAGVGIASIDLPDAYRGKLYDPDFYRTATPEEVRELVGDRSLATESTTYTEKQFARKRGMFGLDDLFSPIIPNSYVYTTSTVVRPVDVARQYSPSQEVIAIIERASGISQGESLAHLLFRKPHDAAASLLEEHKDAPFSCAVSAILAGRSQLPELKAYLEQHPQADLNCTPEGIYLEYGRTTYVNTPLAAAMKAESIETIRFLREKGVTLDSWRFPNNLPPVLPTGDLGDEVLKARGRIPQETCDMVAQDFSYADEATYDFFMRRLFDQCSFSPKAKENMMRNAVIWNRPDMVQKLLGRGAQINTDRPYYIHPSAKGDRTKLKQIIADHGAVLERE